MKRIFLSIFILFTMVGGVGAPLFARAELVPPVTNFIAVSKGTSAITLSWETPNYDIASFEVLYSTGSGAQIAATGMPYPIPGQAQSFDVTGLNANTAYDFEIRAIGVIGAQSLPKYANASTQAAAVSATVPPAMNATATADSATAVTFAWDTPVYADASSFSVVYSTSVITDTSFSSATQVSNVPAPISGSHQSVSVSGLNANTQYYFGIKVVNSSNVRSTAVYASATTQSSSGGGGGGGGSQAVTVPPVMNLAATSTDSYADLSWDTPAGTALQKFEVRYSTSQLNDSNFSAGTNVSGLPVPVSNTSQGVRIMSLASNTQYYFAVRVVNVDGVSSLIKYVSVQTASNVTVPPVMNLTATGKNASVITLEWDTPRYQNASYFQVIYSLTPINEASFTALNPLPGAPSPISQTHQVMDVMGLNANTTYYFGIRIVSTGNVKSAGAFTYATTQTSGGGGGGGGGSVTIPPVMNLASNPSDTYVDVSWNTPLYGNLSKFEMRYSTTALVDANFQTVGTVLPGLPAPVSNTSQGTRVLGLSPATKYYFGIRIYDSSNNASQIKYTSATTSGGGGGGGGAGGSGGSGGGGIAAGASYQTHAATSTLGAPIVRINGGASTTRDQLVTLTLQGASCKEMMISNNADLAGGAWETFATTTKWMLSGGEGVNTIYVKCRADSRISDVGSASITYDRAQEIASAQNGLSGGEAEYRGSYITIAPQKFSVMDGDTVVVVLSAHPNDYAYSAKATVSYPTSTMRLVKIEYGRGWVPEYGNGLNMEDVSNGLFIKTATYKGGFATPKHFATLTFVAIKSGDGTVVADTSLVSPRTDTVASIDVLENNVTKPEYYAASILTLIREKNSIAIMTMLSVLVIFYMAYLILRDRKRHGRVWVDRKRKNK